jgi:hypothetical protein
VERAGENKFFGFGICQKLTATILDSDREIDLTKSNLIEVAFGVQENFLYPYPVFFVEVPERDATTNTITVTAYDALYRAAAHRVSELRLETPYTIRDFAHACAALLDMPINIEVNDGSFDLEFEEDANFDGTESIRQALDAIAEATQSIYFLNDDWTLTFKRIDRAGNSVLTIQKGDYAQLITGETLSLDAICHVTELGDNVIAGAVDNGVIQYIRNNPFWELRTDLPDLLNKALAVVGGTQVAQFDCSWWGNYLLQIGDKIDLVTRDDNVITSYVLDDTIVFDGSITEDLSWHFDIDNAEGEATPTSLGDAISQVYARVDRVNKKISLVASENGETLDRVAKIELTLDSITSTVEALEEIDETLGLYDQRMSEIKQTADDITLSVVNITNTIEENQEATSSDIATLKEQVDMKVSSQDVTIAIQSELSNGVDKVKTTVKQYTFDDEGLTIASSENAISTQITEDGMTISDNYTEVLTAKSEGVKAKNLHATTYLIIGNNSRFQDYGNRTGCFWIGG